MNQPKLPPPGVETEPQGDVVPLKEAASRLGKDPRTLIKAITAGQLRGGAMPRPERLRWYVYADELPSPPGPPTANRPVSDGVLQDLRAQIVSLTEANRLLIAAQQGHLEAQRTASRRTTLSFVTRRGETDPNPHLVSPR